MNDKFDKPDKFEDAWNHPDIWNRRRWRESIIKELNKMLKHKVWERCNSRDIPNGQRPIKYKWVFEIKRNGVYRSRLVACGYSQIPGIDFTESHAPVVNDVTCRLLYTTQMVYKHVAKTVDIETAFLHGVLRDELYMATPKGMNYGKHECCKLIKAIYGTVQAAATFFKTVTKSFKEIGFEPSRIDPCLFMRGEGKDIVYMALYVDDLYIIGNLENVDKAIGDVQSKYKLKLGEGTSDYLSCEVKFNKDMTKAWIGQPPQIKKLKQSYGSLTKGVRLCATPGTPNLVIVRPEDHDKTRLNDEDQKVYRSCVGMLLYLVKYSRPDITNAVRELTKCMDKANKAAYKECTRVLKYVIETEDYGLLTFALCATSLSCFLSCAF